MTSWRASQPAGPSAGGHAGVKSPFALVAEIRPELHRYCARMTGSVAEVTEQVH